VITADHPFFFLLPLFQREGAQFRFSKYAYTPDALFDDREILDVPGAVVTADWVTTLIESLPKHQELAIHSEVVVKNRKLHIPMIDFAATAMTAEVGERLLQFVPSEVCRAMGFFATGRSFHAYSLQLLPPIEWQDFMGRLLLVNPKGGPDIVDSRWVGHRIIGKFASLRWSNNSGSYVSLPRKIESPFFRRNVVNS
jgi:hypothetical protein